MCEHLAEGLTEEQLKLYREIQLKLSSTRSATHEDLHLLMSVIDDLAERLQASMSREIPDGFELRWTISDDILGVPTPQVVKMIDVDEINQGILPLHQEDAA